MNIETFVAVLTIPILVEKLTFAHLSKIVLMKVVTGITLFTEALEPMFADIVVIVSTVVMLSLLCGCGMTIGATSASRTLTGGGEIRASWDSRGESSESVRAKVRSEAEVVGWFWRWMGRGRGAVNGSRSALYCHRSHCNDYPYK